MEGLVYLLNQAGVALAQTSQRIAQLEQQLQECQAALAETRPAGTAPPQEG